MVAQRPCRQPGSLIHQNDKNTNLRGRNFDLNKENIENISEKSGQ